MDHRIVLDRADFLPKGVDVASIFGPDDPVGAAIDVDAFPLPAGAFSAGEDMLFVDRHIIAVSAKVDAGRHAGYPASHDDHFLLHAAIVPPSKKGRRSKNGFLFFARKSGFLAFATANCLCSRVQVLD